MLLLALKLGTMVKKDLVLSIARLLDSPPGKVAMLLQFIEGRAQFLFDLGRVLVFGDVQDLADLSLAAGGERYAVGWRTFTLDLSG